jgi:hypothetical protein
LAIILNKVKQSSPVDPPEDFCDPGKLHRLRSPRGAPNDESLPIVNKTKHPKKGEEKV